MHYRGFYLSLSSCSLIGILTFLRVYEIQYIQATSARLLITLLGDTLACTGSSELVSSDLEDLGNAEMYPGNNH